MSIRNLLKPDVSIIGAGIIGNSIALSLQRKGFQVSVYDTNSSPGLEQLHIPVEFVECIIPLDSVKLSWEGYHHFLNWEILKFRQSI